MILSVFRIPLLYSRQEKHWALAVVDYTARTVAVLDSLPSLAASSSGVIPVDDDSVEARVDALRK
jgi:hypothetical protein